MSIQTFNNIFLEVFYTIMGVVMLITAFMTFNDKELKTRIGTSAFWLILGFIFIAGKYIPATFVGVLILVLGLLTAAKQVKIGKISTPTESFRLEQAKKIGGAIFLPSVTLAIFALGITQFTKINGQVAIGLSSAAALIITLVITKSPAKNIALDGDRMLQQVGPSSILPQLLAALGTVFTTAGVGKVISDGISTVIPQGNILAGITAYCIGMAVFTIIMGNGFAAFTVITAGVGVPFVLSQGANPAVAGALALTAGYCGTLLTPMAANFNVVPAALLETKNKNRVILTQAPVAIAMLIIHIFLMYFLAF